MTEGITRQDISAEATRQVLERPDPALAIATALLYRELETGVDIEELGTRGVRLAQGIKQIILSRK